jgi:hypothetical protein
MNKKVKAQFGILLFLLFLLLLYYILHRKL